MVNWNLAFLRAQIYDQKYIIRWNCSPERFYKDPSNCETVQTIRREQPLQNDLDIIKRIINIIT